MAAVGHFGCPKFTFDKNFWPFQIDTQPFLSHFWPFISILNFFYFYKMAGGGHFGCSKIAFDGISGHFRSIGHFGYLKFTFDGISGHFR